MLRFLIGALFLGYGILRILTISGICDCDFIFDWICSLNWGAYIVPILAILVGLGIWGGGRKRSRRPNAVGADPDGRVRINSRMGGEEFVGAGRKFTGADVECFMGGATLNLNGAIIEGEVLVNVKTFMGGLEIKVDPDVKVVVESNCLFAGVSNKTKLSNPDTTKIIRVVADCTMGGVDIKN